MPVSLAFEDAGKSIASLAYQGYWRQNSDEKNRINKTEDTVGDIYFCSLTLIG